MCARTSAVWRSKAATACSGSSMLPASAVIDQGPVTGEVPFTSIYQTDAAPESSAANVIEALERTGAGLHLKTAGCLELVEITETAIDLRHSIIKFLARD